jgi:vanillate O-demethylase monooxygenase subunit
MFLHNAWYVAAWDHEVGRQMLSRRILGKPVVLFRTTGGMAVALEDRCVHRFLPLSRGELRDDQVVCGYHGMTYDASGKCVRIPGQSLIPRTARVRSYRIAERWGCVFIWMGDVARADESEIIDVPFYNDESWAINRGEPLHIRAHYQLITDNLLDPTHVSYVHTSTFGTQAVAEIPVQVKHQGRTVSVTRHIPDSPPAPFFAKVGRFTGNVDRWQVYSLNLPSTAVVDAGSKPSGIDAAAEAASVRINSYNFITPETDRSSFYFYFQLRNFAPNDESMTALMNDQFAKAFHEDKVVLEDIQSMIDSSGEEPHFNLAIDNASVRARHMLERLIAAESKAA